jgi:succinate dehydrogenase/fumarate reductase flavoprotein subunit
VHTLKYSINPSDYFKSDERTVNIIAQNYAEAEKLLVNSIGEETRFNITMHEESNFEVHAISDEMQDLIYNSFKAARGEMTARKSLKERLIGR